MQVPIRTSDRAWLHMDRPNNLMYINGIMWLAGEPDWEAVQQVISERIVDRFPVFHRRAVEEDGTWYWQDDPDFSLDRHVRRVTLPEPGTSAVAREYLSSRVSQPFAADRPLWEIDFISNVVDENGDVGSMTMQRFHHGIADGVRLVQVMLSMCDLDESAIPARVGKTKASRPGLGQLSKSAGKAIRDTVGAGASVAKGLPQLVVSNLKPSALEAGWDVIKDPSLATDAISGLADADNQLVNTWRSVSRLALAGRSVDTVWSGTPGVAKQVGWITGIDLAAVKAIGRSTGGTVNDVLLAAVSKGITAYLRSHGADDVDLVRWMIPVSLKPMDANLPKDLGNHFAVVLLPMPLGVDDTRELVSQMTDRMTRIKNSAEPAIAYGLQKAVGGLPLTLAESVTDLVAEKTVGVLTNVPGPRAPMALAGSEVRGVLGWVPTSGDQVLGLCIFSYNGQVSIGVAADAGLVPDVQELADGIFSAYEQMRDETSS